MLSEEDFALFTRWRVGAFGIDKAVRAARFKIKGACVEDIYYLPDRNLTRDRMSICS